MGERGRSSKHKDKEVDIRSKGGKEGMAIEKGRSQAMLLPETDGGKP
jgi:AMMECR1 domain-containing protein